MPFKEALAIKQVIVKDLNSERRGRKSTKSGPLVLQEINEKGIYSWWQNRFKAETKYIVSGDKLYAELPVAMQLAGIENTVKSRVKRVMIYDEAPFPGLSPTETNDVFTAKPKTLAATLDTAINNVLNLTDQQTKITTASRKQPKIVKPIDSEFIEQEVAIEQVCEKNPICLFDTVMARPIPIALKKAAMKLSISQLHIKTQQVELGCRDAERRMHQLTTELEIAREELTVLQTQ